MTYKSLLGPAIGTVVGAFIGHSQVLCLGGHCMITGSWLGGALLGGIVGYLLYPGISHDQDGGEPERIPVRTDDQDR